MGGVKLKTVKIEIGIYHVGRGFIGPESPGEFHVPVCSWFAREDFPWFENVRMSIVSSFLR